MGLPLPIPANDPDPTSHQNFAARRCRLASHYNLTGCDFCDPAGPKPVVPKLLSSIASCHVASENRALLDSDQQINSVFSHPVVRSSVGNRVGKLALRLKPRPSRTATLPPCWTGRGAFARETGGQRKYLGPKNPLVTICLRGNAGSTVTN